MEIQQTAYRSGCFIAGTMVTMANGDLQPIESIQVGDMVMTWNTSVTNKSCCEPNRVVELLRPIRPTIITLTWLLSTHIDDTIKTRQVSCTPDHPFWVMDRGWCAWQSTKTDGSISPLRIGDICLSLGTDKQRLLARLVTLPLS
jgi:hypothetical protein